MLIVPTRRSLITGAAALAAYGSLARAGINHGIASGGGGATWDPASLLADWTLSGGNLTATHGSTTNNCVRATTSLSTGTPSWKVTINSGTSGGPGFGFMTSGHSLNTTLGTDTFSLSCVNGGSIFINSANVGSWGGTFSVGDTIEWKYIAATPSISVSVNGGAFTTPFSILTWFGANTVFFPAMGTSDNGASFTGNFGTWV